MRKLISATIIAAIVMSGCHFTVFAFDNIVWERETDKPTGVGNISSTVVDSRIFVFGRDLTTTYNSNFEIFDTISKTWSSGAPMPTPRDDVGCGAIDRKIYVFGGRFNLTNPDRPKQLEIYDVDLDSWTVGADKPNGVYDPISTVFEEKVYSFGGRGINDTYLNVIEIYDPATDTWSTRSPMPRARSGGCAFVFNNKIYLIGGRYSNSSFASFVDIYDPISDTWETTAQIPINISAQSGALINGRIYYFVGSSLLIYDILADTWETLDANLTTVRSGGAVGVVNDRLYMVSGLISASQATNLVESFALSDNPEEKLYVLLYTGETAQLSVDYNLAENRNFTWSSTIPGVASVGADGKVTALSEGTTQVYCVSSDGAFNDYIPVKVVPEGAEKRLAVHLTPSETARLWITDDYSSVTWSSMDPSVATVNANGVVTGIDKGLCIVQGQVDGKVFYIYVRVE